MTDKALLRDCLKFIQEDCAIVQCDFKIYIDLEERLVKATTDDNLESQPHIVNKRDTIDLRDMMAASLVLPADLSRQTGRVLAGQEPAEGIELIKWWARAKARLRYIEVDAMLEARDK